MFSLRTILVFYISNLIFCYFISPFYYIYLINSATSYFSDSHYFSVYSIVIVTCCQSDSVVDETQCQRILH